MASKGQSVDNMSDETFDFICTTCDEKGKIVEAVKYCIECQGYCCQACTDMHYETFPVLKTHTLLDAVQGNQASNIPPKLPEFPTERCGIHQGNILDLYCEDHNDIVCCNCVAADHKHCPKKSIYSIPEKLDMLFKINECKHIRSRLRGVIVSMTTLGKSKDAKLGALKDAKEESIQKVENFQKILEAIIERAVNASRQEIETRYQELVKEVLQDKESIENFADSLQASEKKLEKTGGNRAQHFVSVKLAEKKMKETLAFEEEIRNADEKHLIFTPSQQLINYVTSLQSIGTVDATSKKRPDIQKKPEKIDINSQVSEDSVEVSTSKKLDLYKIKASKDVNIKVTGDYFTCDLKSCCLTLDNALLVTDFVNKKLKRIDVQSLKIIDYCTLDSQPYGVCCISQHKAVVACGDSNKIQFVSIDNKMKPTSHIKLSHCCFGVASYNDKLYVSDRSSFYVYDMTGNMLNTSRYHNSDLKSFSKYTLVVNIAVSVDGKKLYVSGLGKGIVCFDNVGNHLSTYTGPLCRTMFSACGICVDGKGHLFVTGHVSHFVVQLNEDGKKIGVVVKQQDGLQNPRSVCFQQTMNKLFVTMRYSDVLKMYELY